MVQQIINIGAVANDHTGDTLRVGGDKINDNFTELYAGVTGTLIQTITVSTSVPSGGSDGDVWLQVANT